MKPFRLSRAMTVAACALLLPTLAVSATTVPSNASSPVLIGVLLPGVTYDVSASGIADLFAGFNAGNGLTFTADGRPTYAFPSPYAAFFPNGLDHDPSVGPSNKGVGGAGRLLGSLLGTYTATPTGPADYFTIGLGTTLTQPLGATLYGQVNDTEFRDNSATGFSVTLTAAVPEPATVALMLAGLGIVAGAAGRRRASR